MHWTGDLDMEFISPVQSYIKSVSYIMYLILLLLVYHTSLNSNVILVKPGVYTCG